MREPQFPPNPGYIFEAEVMDRAREKWGADALAYLLGQHLLTGALHSWRVDEAGQQTEIAVEEYRCDLKLRDALTYRPRGRWDTRYREPHKFRVVFAEAEIDELLPTPAMRWRQTREEKAKNTVVTGAPAQEQSGAESFIKAAAAQYPGLPRLRQKILAVVAELEHDGIMPGNSTRRDVVISDRLRETPYNESTGATRNTIKAALKARQKGAI